MVKATKGAADDTPLNGERLRQNISSRCAGVRVATKIQQIAKAVNELAKGTTAISHFLQGVFVD